VNFFIDPTLVGLESAISNNLPQQSQRIAMNSILPHQYEVTENNDMVIKQHQPLQSTIFQSQQNLDTRRLSSIINPYQFNGFFLNHLVNSNTGIAKSFRIYSENLFN